MTKGKNNKNNKLKMLFIGTGIVFLLFLVSFFVYAALASNTGDADLNSFGAVFAYHFKSLGQLFIFQYGGGHNIAFLALSYVLYALIAIFVIFLVLGIRIMKATGRRIQVFGFVAAFLNIIKYMFFASGAEKYWEVINRLKAFANHGELLIPTILLVVFGLLYTLAAVACYFITLIEAYKNPKNEAFKEEEAYDNVAKEEVEQIVTNVIRRELASLRIAEQKPQEEIVEKPAEEVPPEEPAPEEPQPEEAPVEEAPKEEQPVEEAPVEPQPEEQPAEEVPAEEPKEEEPQPKETPEEAAEEADDINEEEMNIDDVDDEEEDDMDAEDGDNENGDIFDGKRRPRMPYNMRLLTSEAELKANYNEIKNEIMSYGVKYRMSKKGELFCLHRKRYVKIYLVGKMLKVYFALNPEDYHDSPIPLEDVGYRAAYSETPLLLKVRSPLSVRRCKQLIADTMKADKRQQGEVGNTNWIAKLREANSNRNKNKEKKKQ